MNEILRQKAQFEKGKFFDTGDELICVLQLEGSWYEMGKQYGTLAKSKIEPMWAGTVQPILDKKWMTEKDALDLFGKRTFEASNAGGCRLAGLRVRGLCNSGL